MNPHQKPQEDVVGLIERLRAQEDSGLRTMGGGSISHDGKFNMWGNDKIMRRRNPDGEEAALLIERLLAAPTYEAGRRDMREGWVLVPREPTDAMWRAGSDAFEAFEDSRHAFAVGAKRIWSAMLEALPTEPLGGEGKP